jgi:hypothetical protein
MCPRFLKNDLHTLSLSLEFSLLKVNFKLISTIDFFEEPMLYKILPTRSPIIILGYFGKYTNKKLKPRKNHVGQ